MDGERATQASQTTRSVAATGVEQLSQGGSDMVADPQNATPEVGIATKQPSAPAPLPTALQPPNAEPQSKNAASPARLDPPQSHNVTTQPVTPQPPTAALSLPLNDTSPPLVAQAQSQTNSISPDLEAPRIPIGMHTQPHPTPTHTTMPQPPNQAIIPAGDQLAEQREVAVPAAGMKTRGGQNPKSKTKI